MRVAPGIAAFAAALIGTAPPLHAQQGGGALAPETGVQLTPGTDAAPPVVRAQMPLNPEHVLPVMTLDQDALYRRSAWGQRVQAALEKRGREIADENDRLAAQFSAEEQELTELRQTLPAEEFRQRADEFDQRVVEVRREREETLRELQAQADEERNAFLRAILPVLTRLMQERGVVAILDQRAIFVASDSIDVTDELIARMDAEVGAGPIEPPPADDTPADDAPAEDAQEQGAVPEIAPDAGNATPPEPQE